MSYFRRSVLLLFSLCVLSDGLDRASASIGGAEDKFNVIICYADKCDEASTIAESMKGRGDVTKEEMEVIETYAQAPGAPRFLLESSDVDTRRPLLLKALYASVALARDAPQSTSIEVQSVKDSLEDDAKKGGGAWESLSSSYLPSLKMEVLRDPLGKLDSGTLSKLAKRLPCLCGDPLPDRIYDAKDFFNSQIEDTRFLEVSKKEGKTAEEKGVPVDYVIPNDPLFSQMGWNLIQSGFAHAWKIFTGSTGMTIAVVDTGCSFHPDLAQNLWIDDNNPNCKSADHENPTSQNGCYGVDVTKRPYGNPLTELMDHGTGVSGIISATGNNQYLSTGGCWGCKIMCIKVADKQNKIRTSYLVAAYDYIATKKVKISNHSYSAFGPDPTQEMAVAKLLTHDHLFIAAAGNNKCDLDSKTSVCMVEGDPVKDQRPGAYQFQNLISVASTTHLNVPSPNTNFGSLSVDIFAPGDRVFVLCNSYLNVNETSGKHYYVQLKSGTSFAAPVVTAAAALVWGANPSMTALQVKERILSSATKIDSLKGKCVSGGLLNVEEAMKNSQLSDSPDDIRSSPKQDLTKFFYETKSKNKSTNNDSHDDASPSRGGNLSLLGACVVLAMSQFM